MVKYENYSLFKALVMKEITVDLYLKLPIKDRIISYPLLILHHSAKTPITKNKKNSILIVLIFITTKSFDLRSLNICRK